METDRLLRKKTANSFLPPRRWASLTPGPILVVAVGVVVGTVGSAAWRSTGRPWSSWWGPFCVGNNDSIFLDDLPCAGNGWSTGVSFGVRSGGVREATHSRTVGQNNQDYRLEYRAIRSSADTAHSFACSGLLASLARSLCSLPRSVGKWMIVCLKMTWICPTVSRSGDGGRRGARRHHGAAHGRVTGHKSESTGNHNKGREVKELAVSPERGDRDEFNPTSVAEWPSS